MAKILWSALLIIGAMGSAAAGADVPAVPAPDIGGGVMGMLLAAGAVYLIKRRGH